MPEVETCVHWWLIETPEGPTSEGRCKFCGKTRRFINGPQKRSPYKETNLKRLIEKGGPLDATESGG